MEFDAVEICAGAGGQALGLHQAGFTHRVAVEIDEQAAATLRTNSKRLTDGGWRIEVGDVADAAVWRPEEFQGVTLLAGGVPCPPFSLAGKQLGSADERDLFAWAIEQVAIIQPRAVMLENVRGLSSQRFSAYRQRILDRLAELGYVGQWKLLQAADFGVAQLRPRFILVALRPEDARYFHWPESDATPMMTVGAALHTLMASGGWKYADEWAQLADDVGPTIVGGSKKHGGADLGPTRAKEAWRRLFVDAKGVADAPPSSSAPSATISMPRLTIPMVARLQGWQEADDWVFEGRKTAQYRQIGNAFPPPLARAIGESIASALRHEGNPVEDLQLSANVHSPVYRALASSDGFITLGELVRAENADSTANVERQLAAIERDFELEKVELDGKFIYRLGEFRGFVGQQDHARHKFFETKRNRVS